MIQKSNNVEFFVQESSFGDSRYTDEFLDYDSTIPQEIQNIFACLQKQLFPYETQVNKQNIQVLVNRARILYNQSIPQQKHILEKNYQTSQSKRNQAIFNQCSDELKKLLNDYDSYKKQVLPYKEFYNKYGRDKNQDFRKREYSQTYFDMQPEIVQIVEQKVQDRGLKNNYPFANSANDGFQQQQSQAKEILQLRQEIKRILRREKKLKKQYEIALNNEKIINETRVNRLFNLRWEDKAPTLDKEFSILQKQFADCQQKLLSQQNTNQQLRVKLERYEKIIDQKDFENSNLLRQLESHKKLANSRFSQQSQGAQSMKSQFNMPASDVNKLQKMNKNLKNQNHLLKNQLNKIRQINYAIKKGNANDLQAEIQVSKKAYEKLETEYRILQQKCDNLKVENLRLHENQKFIQKVIEHLKKQNIDIRDQMKQNKDTGQFLQQTPPRDIQKSRNTLPNILNYEGDGLEGLPYYDILSRQYKVRFRRSCLKEKELLYKHSGLEVGVITELVQANQIKIILHLTNYTEKSMRNIKLKTLNPNENKINLQSSKIDELKPEQQKKILLYSLIRYYPIGPVIIAIQFQNLMGKAQQARILLPVHIFKMMEFKKRTQSIKRGRTKTCRLDHKIVKDFNALNNLFKKIAPSGNSTLEIEAIHRHTQTIIFLQLTNKGDQIEIIYQTFDGSDKITQYFITTLIFLLAREQ